MLLLSPQSDIGRQENPRLSTHWAKGKEGIVRSVEALMLSNWLVEQLGSVLRTELETGVSPVASCKAGLQD